MDDALASAARGFAIWRAVGAWERSAVLRRMADIVRAEVDRYAAVMTAELSKPLAQSVAEVLSSADQFDWYADEARRIYGRTVDGHSPDMRITVRREPIGPVAAFAAWNFPSLLPARKIAPALAAGCSIIVAAPVEAPLSCLLFAEAAQRAGLPDSVLTILTGEPPRISERLIESPVIRKVSLTGSVPVGILLNTHGGPHPEVGQHGTRRPRPAAGVPRRRHRCRRPRRRAWASTATPVRCASRPAGSWSTSR